MEPTGLIAELTPFVTPGLGGLLAATVILLLTGRLIPVSTLNRELEAERQRANDFKAALEAANARSETLAASVAELMPYARNADALLTELRRRVDQGS